MKVKWCPVALVCSLAANLVLAYPLVNRAINDPIDRLGRLTRPVEVGAFGGSDVLFRLPADLTVRDASPTGLAAIGQFEPYRFSIIVTTDDPELVSYAVRDEELRRDEEYYSIELSEPFVEE